MATFKTSLSVELPASLPEWIELLPSGTFSGRDGRGPWHCTPSDVIARTREYQGGVDIPVDYDTSWNTRHKTAARLLRRDG